mmetsp:Transcript_12469/g.49915  ORF Transcript_12469/g.49915 Transcript_12469/m.49915 type:complete len:383 (-) Transcript_12469:735-1883(-)
MKPFLTAAMPSLECFPISNRSLWPVLHSLRSLGEKLTRMRSLAVTECTLRSSRPHSIVLRRLFRRFLPRLSRLFRSPRRLRLCPVLEECLERALAPARPEPQHSLLVLLPKEFPPLLKCMAGQGAKMSAEEVEIGQVDGQVLLRRADGRHHGLLLERSEHSVLVSPRPFQCPQVVAPCLTRPWDVAAASDVEVHPGAAQLIVYVGGVHEPNCVHVVEDLHCPLVQRSDAVRILLLLLEADVGDPGRELSEINGTVGAHSRGNGRLVGLPLATELERAVVCLGDLLAHRSVLPRLVRKPALPQARLRCRQLAGEERTHSVPLLLQLWPHLLHVALDHAFQDLLQVFLERYEEGPDAVAFGEMLAALREGLLVDLAHLLRSDGA